MITNESTPKRAEIPWRNIDWNAIVVLPREGILYPLNSVATEIWVLSDGTRRVANIIDTLVETFEAGEDEIRQDTFRFLEQLEKVSLITIEGGPHGV